MFLDDTACNLASLNLVQFLDSAGHFERGDSQSMPHLDVHARDQRPDGAIPEQGCRTKVLRLPDARSRLREHGHVADADGLRTIPRRLRLGAAISALQTGPPIKRRQRWPRVRPFPRYDANAEQMGAYCEPSSRGYGVPDAEYEELTIKPTTHAPNSLRRRHGASAIDLGQCARYW